MDRNKERVKKLAMSAMFLALALALPLINLGIPAIGNMLLPMHLPILLAGLVLGPYYGLILGLIAPLLRSLIFGMPSIYPTAICMAFELASYGLIIGLFYKFFKERRMKEIPGIYLSLIISIIGGRLVWGLSRYLTGLFGGGILTFKIFIASAFLNAWPGIIIQLILIPLLFEALKKARLSYPKSMDYVNEEELNKRIASLIEKGPLVVAIDGMSASGKSTLTDRLLFHFGGRAIHMDDFYLPANQRNEKTIKELGGNIDRLRFKAEVLDHLNGEIEYAPFSCESQTLLESKILPFTKLTIIEGAYALQKEFGHYYGLSIYLGASRSYQRYWLKRRDITHFNDFIKVWVPKENKYLRKEKIMEHADLRLYSYKRT